MSSDKITGPGSNTQLGTVVGNPSPMQVSLTYELPESGDFLEETAPGMTKPAQIDLCFATSSPFELVFHTLDGEEVRRKLHLNQKMTLEIPRNNYLMTIQVGDTVCGYIRNPEGHAFEAITSWISSHQDKIDMGVVHAEAPHYYVAQSMPEITDQDIEGTSVDYLGDADLDGIFDHAQHSSTHVDQSKCMTLYSNIFKGRNYVFNEEYFVGFRIRLLMSQPISSVDANEIKLVKENGAVIPRFKSRVILDEEDPRRVTIFYGVRKSFLKWLFLRGFLEKGEQLSLHISPKAIECDGGNYMSSEMGVSFRLFQNYFD